MNESDWQIVAAEAEAGLLEAGSAAFIVTPGEKFGPANNPQIGPGDEHACVALRDSWDQKVIDGTTIKHGDIKLLVGASSLGVTPEIGMLFRFTSGGKDYKICAPLNIVAPGGTPVLYELNVRG